MKQEIKLILVIFYKFIVADDRITLQGNKKHHTKHNEYVCYNCGAILDRDENAVNNLLDLI